MSRIFEIVQAMSGQKNCIVIPRPYIDFSEDQQAFALAAVLNQLVFWSGKSSRDDGWFYKGHQELAGEIGLSEDQVQRVVKSSGKNTCLMQLRSLTARLTGRR